MGLGQLLFNPNGRISQRQFWQGTTVLVAALVCVCLLMYISSLLIGWLLLFGSLIVFILPYAFLYGKRLHDSGHSAWLFLAFFAAYLVLWLLTSDIFYIIWGVDVEAMMVLMQEANSSGEPEQVFEVGEQFLKAHAFPAATAIIVYNGLIGLVPGVFMKPDPFENMHGAPLNSVHTEFE